MRNYSVTHRTRYRYESPVGSSYGRFHLLPRDLLGQICHRSSVEIDPAPQDVSEWRDYFGNRAGWFSLQTPHMELTVTATSVVEVAASAPLPAGAAEQPWEEVRELVASLWGDELVRAREFTLDSPLVVGAEPLAAYAAASFRPGRALADALADLVSRVYADFAYVPGATSVSTPVADVLERRAGVCQDFAHVVIGCLRSVGLAARYVSGYLETRPPEGQEKLQGADASHAWVSVFVPGAGWIAADPTNDQFVDDRYVTVGWGRDYSDVAPIKGVIYTQSHHSDLSVEVDVVRV